MDEQTTSEPTKADGLKSRKFWVAVAPLFFILVVASVFAFLVGETGPDKQWIGRLSSAQWVDMAKWCGWVIGVYVLGNVAEKGVAALALFKSKPPEAK